ncbi:MAG: hypothetical protein ABW136_05095 [Steroidobacteraceae bacterium]
MIRIARTLALALLPLTAAAAPAIDACALLKAEQIADVIGQPVEAGVRRDSGLEENGAYSSSCVWLLTAEKALPRPRSLVILNALQFPYGSGRAHEFLDTFREAADSGVLANAPVARRFGDEALWWGDGLAVRRHDVSFGLSVYLPKSPAAKPGAREEQLAPLVLAQIDRRKTSQRL